MHIWTVGHWTCPQDVFIDRLRDQSITALVDVRSLPGSRNSPWFGRELMVDWLDDAGIQYEHVKLLGGRRKAQHPVEDVNGGWENQSFRNYADYTLTQDFEDGLEELLGIAVSSRTAIMCGEPMPWRCHRSMISTVLVARGHQVSHILADRVVDHELGKWGARPSVSDGRVTYPK